MTDVIRISVKVNGGPVKGFRGRFAQTLHLLIRNGPAGLSSLESPGVRLGGYIHRLRREGVPIETQHEKHGGPYAGNHARYRLCGDVEVIDVAVLKRGVAA